MKKLLMQLSILTILCLGFYVATSMADTAPTYDGRGTDLQALYADPTANQQAAIANPDGIADIIVGSALADTHAENVVTAVLFDYRGYDTMGEALVLFTAIAGCLAILRKTRKEVVLNEEPQSKKLNS